LSLAWILAYGEEEAEGTEEAEKAEGTYE